MRATLSWWSLNESKQTIESLREYLRDEGVDPWSNIAGLRLKFWFADPDTNRWGAVMLWEDDADLSQPLPPHRAVELIGYGPTERIRAEVEATVEGRFAEAALSGIGHALMTVEASR